MTIMRRNIHHTYFIELTNHCNMHCSFCPSDELMKSRQLAGDDVVEKCIRQIAEIGPETGTINFNVLGEPLLNRKIFNYIALCKSLGVRCAVVTNLTLLTPKNIKKLLAHDNLVLVLSVQTPTPQSYEIRGYKHMSFDDYMAIIDRVILTKFEIRSNAWIEIHIADNNPQENFYRENGQPPWSIYADEEEQRAAVDQLVERCRSIAEHVKAQYGEFYETAIRPDYVSEDCGAMQENPNIREHEFWGWMFAPNVFFRVKSFGLFARQKNFLDKFLEPTEKAFVEEAEGGFTCDMAKHAFAMLTDGQFTACCLDYDGEIDFGHIRDKTVAQALWSIDRTRLLDDASVHKACRRCKGRAFVFDTSPPAANRCKVEMFGRGWHDWEADLSGRGGRWSNGAGVFYVYGRSQITSISLDLISMYPEGTELKLIVSKADDSLENFSVAHECAFHARSRAPSKVDLPTDLPAGALYKFLLVSPSFRPREVLDIPDDRRLGLAVYGVEAVFAGAVPDKSSAALEPMAETVAAIVDRALRGRKSHRPTGRETSADAASAPREHDHHTVIRR